MERGHAVVIGAAGGIGRACLTAFRDAGWTVTGADVNAGDGLHSLDVTKEADVRLFADAAGETDALVYAAGIVATMPITTMDFGKWRRIMAVNLDGAAFVASAFASRMIARGKGGSMVFLSSAAGVRGEANASAYSASKAGLIGLVESIASELVPHRIRVNAVAPGNVDTPMLREVARGIAAASNRSEESVWGDLARTGAADRIIGPEEVAAVCVALCSPGFSGVTGTTLPVDAGYLLA